MYLKYNFYGINSICQGDPLSPYLFVLYMEVLTLLINRLTFERQMRFHLKCRKTGNTDLIFTDDLLVLTDGQFSSVNALCSTLENLYHLSGLRLNAKKTEFFCSSLSESHILELVSISGFKRGTLPMQYLGVPLISSKLRASNCSSLIECMVACIKSWTSKSLSFVGHLQLIKSVLHSMASDWMRHFILPKKVIKRVQQIYSAFLWKGEATNAKGARVSWNELCLPNKEGGLGLKDIEKWNQVSILQNIWQLLMNSRSLWMA